MDMDAGAPSATGVPPNTEAVERLSSLFENGPGPSAPREAPFLPAGETRGGRPVVRAFEAVRMPLQTVVEPRPYTDLDEDLDPNLVGMAGTRSP